MKKKKRKILILETNAGGGHLSITSAIMEAIEEKAPELEVIRGCLDLGWMDKFYKFSARKFIHLYSLLFKVTDNKSRSELASKINLVLQRNKIKQIIKEHKPDLILSNTQFGVREVPTVIKELKWKIPFLVFVPDPFTMHSVCFTPKASLTLVPSLAAFQKGLLHDIPVEKLKITGHPVRKDFYKPPKSIKKLKNKLGLEEKKLSILFGGSGDGAERTLEILIYLGAKPSRKLLKHMLKAKGSEIAEEMKGLAKELMTGELSENTPSSVLYSKKSKPVPFQAVVVTGTNTKLKKQLEQLEFPEWITPHIYGHVKDMASLMHASDMVVGKAGPNIIFEACAAGKPFLATYHIKGQEDGNLDFIRSMQIGFVEEKPKQAAKLIDVVVNNPGLLDFTKEGIGYANKQNKKSSKLIAEEVVNLI